MTPINNTCPRCASPVGASIPDVGIQFECAAIAFESGHFSEALPCVMRQRDQLATELKTLRTANAALVDRVKQLEEVGDIMATAYEEILWDNHDATILENYRKVRSGEGKP